jgi:outer membrane beta-barrel protein
MIMISPGLTCFPGSNGDIGYMHAGGADGPTMDISAISSLIELSFSVNLSTMPTILLRETMPALKPHFQPIVGAGRTMRAMMSRVSFFVMILGLLLARQAQAQDEETVADLLARYRARRIEVVAPRELTKQRAVELEVLIGVIPNDAFLIYLPVGLRLGYHLTERWSVELSGEYYVSFDTGLRTFLEENDAALKARLRDRQQLQLTVGGGWAPVYGKLALGEHVLHLDGYLAVGGGLVHTAEEKTLGQTAAFCPDFYAAAGIRLMLSRRWMMRWEYRQHVFLRPSSSSGQGGGVGFPAEIALLWGVLLGGGR